MSDAPTLQQAGLFDNPPRRRGRKTRPPVWCAKCDKMRKHHARGLCQDCYVISYRPRIRECVKCWKLRKHCARGLCQACYMDIYEPPPRPCLNCGETRRHIARGLCRRCYEPPARECARCGEVRPHEANDLCHAGYRRHRRVLEMAYGPVCQLCGKIHESSDTLTVDHIHPVARMESYIGVRDGWPDGINSYANLQLACRSCNSAKGDRLLD